MTMFVLVAGAHGRLGGRIVALLLHRGHRVRGLVRSEGQATALRGLGADAVVADLRGDVEWTAAGCDAAIFAAGARHRPELGAIDAGGAAKLAEAAARYEHSRFLLCSAIGAHAPQRRSGAVREFLEAKQHAEQRLARLDMPWTILRFGRLTESSGTGHVETHIHGDSQQLVLSRDDAALAVADALDRSHLARRAVHLIEGDRPVAQALDAIEPRRLPPPAAAAANTAAALGAAQSDNPPDAADMIATDAAPMDADVEWVGDGPVPQEPAGNDDPAPGIP